MSLSRCTLNSLVNGSKRLYDSCRLLTTSQLLLLSSSKQGVINKPSAYKALLKSSSVRLCIDELPSSAKQFFNVPVNSSNKSLEYIVVLSSDVQKLIKKTQCSVNLIEDNLQPPLIQLVLKDNVSHSNKNLRKYGINLPDNIRPKIIGFNSNIDECMLNVRLKQIEDFLQANYSVVIIVNIISLKKLMAIRSRQSVVAVKTDIHKDRSNNEQEEIQNLHKMECDSVVKKLNKMLENVPCKMRHVERPDTSKVVMLVEPVK
ncbi:unnamed protein product [Trichobilharzia szidati]|nr:unnamed protein product [Trichobilharzia szidati]